MDGGHEVIERPPIPSYRAPAVACAGLHCAIRGSAGATRRDPIPRRSPRPQDRARRQGRPCSGRTGCAPAGSHKTPSRRNRRAPCPRAAHPLVPPHAPGTDRGALGPTTQSHNSPPKALTQRPKSYRRRLGRISAPNRVPARSAKTPLGTSRPQPRRAAAKPTQSIATSAQSNGLYAMSMGTRARTSKAA